MQVVTLFYLFHTLLLSFLKMFVIFFTFWRFWKFFLHHLYICDSWLVCVCRVVVHSGESPKFGEARRSYSARTSPPHSIEHMLVFPGDSGNISSDSNWLIV